MRHQRWLVALALLFLSACGIHEFIRQNDDRYMVPGALDPLLTGYYDVYQFRFLNRYRISHAWPLPARACKYRSLPTLGRTSDRYKGEVFAAPDIYEQDGKTWQASNTGRPPWEFDRFVAPTYTTKIPEFAEGGIKTGRMIDRVNTGLEPVCFEAWVGTSHSLVLRLHKRDITTWKSMWTEYNPKGYWSQEQIGKQLWQIQETREQDLSATGTGGWFKSALLPIGDTGYSIALQLGATKDSLQHPTAHAQFQTMFRHLLESVKIETLQP
jgi:hypothetical protein